MSTAARQLSQILRRNQQWNTQSDEQTSFPSLATKLNGQKLYSVGKISPHLPSRKREGRLHYRQRKEPEKEDPTHQKWKLEIAWLCPGLLSSMTHETGENFMYYGTAVEIWNAAKETYSNVDNTSAIFRSRAFYTTCDKEIPLLLNTTTLSQGIGSSWIFMRTLTGSVLKTANNTRL
ncbi:hypothetical protein SESBI_06576 [Sesbania bispinosa]|nr:hypothetical protein SESBI_06576 [Sesbania bispinosa]